MIKFVACDIDGVLTDGKVYINSESESKTLCFKDLDAASELKKMGLGFAIITGENDFFSTVIQERFKPDVFVPACKDKGKEIKKIATRLGIGLNEICYIGDGKYDLDVLSVVGLGICPADAIEEARFIARVVLHNVGGNGCLAEAFKYICENHQESSLCTSHIHFQNDKRIQFLVEEHLKLTSTVLNDTNLIKKIGIAVDMIVQSLQVGGKVLFCGNGGSAADAQHLSTEFVSRFYLERPAFDAEALTVNTSTLTSIANDYCYEDVFLRQVEAKGKPGDVLVGITTSGTSVNIIRAFEKAKNIGLKTISFTGNQYQQIQVLSDLVLSVSSSVTPRIQELHILLGHIICELCETQLYKNRQDS